MQTKRVTVDDVWPGDVIVTKEGNLKVAAVHPYRDTNWLVCAEFSDGSAILYRSWSEEVHRVIQDV